LKVNQEEYEQYKLNERLLQEKRDKKKADEEELLKKKEADLKIAKQKLKESKVVKKDNVNVSATNTNTNTNNSDKNLQQVNTNSNSHTTAGTTTTSHQIHHNHQKHQNHQNQVFVEVRPLVETKKNDLNEEMIHYQTKMPESKPDESEQGINYIDLLLTTILVPQKQDNKNDVVHVNLLIPKTNTNTTNTNNNTNVEPAEHKNENSEDTFVNETHNKGKNTKHTHHEAKMNKKHHGHKFDNDQLSVNTHENIHIIQAPKEVTLSNAEKEHIKSINDQLQFAWVLLLFTFY